MGAPKLSRNEIVEILSVTPEQLVDLEQCFSPEQLHRRPAGDGWSMNDVLAHLRACADVWEAAIERILAGDHPTIRAINPRAWLKSTDYPDLQFSESRSRFTEQRQAFLRRLKPLSKTDWNRGATVTGARASQERTVWTYLDRFARHERQHSLQLREIAATFAEA